MESHAAGTPVIGANVGGIPELIQNGMTGTLFESGNSESLAMAIKELWNNMEELNRYTEQCNKMRHHTAKSYVEELLSIYANE